MKVISARFAADTESARAVCPALQPTLHLLAHTHVLELHLVRDRHAVGDELFRLGPFGVREVEVEYDPATIRPERQHQVRVHHALVLVDHQVREDPPVIRILPGADLADSRVLRLLERADLHAAMSVVLAWTKTSGPQESTASAGSPCSSLSKCSTSANSGVPRSRPARSYVQP